MDVKIQRRLGEIVTTLRVEHDQVELILRTALKNALSHAIRAGKLLSEAKLMLNHGEWLPWLEMNFSGTVRTAQRYISFAENEAQLASQKAIEDWTYQEAQRFLAAPKLLGGIATAADGPDAESDELSSLMPSLSEQNITAAAECSRALIEIRDRKLWQASHPSFSAFLEDKFGMNEADVSRYLGVIRHSLCPPSQT